MSGGGTGSTIKQGVGAIGLIVGAAGAPFSGGLTLGLIPGSAALLASGTSEAQGTVKRSQQALNNSLLKPISKPQIAPTTDDAAVIQQRANSLLQLQQRSGRASTLLTNQGAGANNTFGG